MLIICSTHSAVVVCGIQILELSVSTFILGESVRALNGTIR